MTNRRTTTKTTANTTSRRSALPSPATRRPGGAAIYQRPRRVTPGDASDAAFLGFRLRSLGAASLETRLSGCALLLSRLQHVEAALPGASRALELRYVVWPASATPDGEERVDCYILARFEAGLSAANPRQEAREFAATLQSLLGATLPSYRFEPLCSQDEVARALAPFPLRDTAEVRRRVLDSMHATGTPVPLLGLPDADELVELMLRQDAPLALAFCVAPATSVAPLVAAHAFPLQAAHEAMYETLHEATVGAVARSAAGGASRVEALSAGLDDLAAEHWLLQRLASVRQRPFQLRIQAASAARLRDDFLLSLAGEVGGPGRLTAKAAWQTPTLPLAAGAQVVRPRTAQSPRREARAALATLAARDAESENVQENVPSKRRRAPRAARSSAADAGLPESCAARSDARTPKASDQPHAASRGCDVCDEPPNRARTEAEVALGNFALLGFDPWGEDTLPAAEAGLAALADLGEVTRLLSLPLSAPWLPAQSAALALPFRAGTRRRLAPGREQRA